MPTRLEPRAPLLLSVLDACRATGQAELALATYVAERADVPMSAAEAESAARVAHWAALNVSVPVAAVRILQSRPRACAEEASDWPEWMEPAVRACIEEEEESAILSATWWGEPLHPGESHPLPQP